MKITNIEVIPIFPKLASRYAERRVDLYGIDCRVVYKVHTDAGITGYGDMRVRPLRQTIPRRRRPVHWPQPFRLRQRPSLHRPLGPTLRPVRRNGQTPRPARSQTPRPEKAQRHRRSRLDPPRLSRDLPRRDQTRRGRGLSRVFKIHTCTYHDVFEQTRLATEVAPESFRIHYDFNHNRSLGSALPIIAELERNFPIVGYIEDPLDKKDIDGWKRLRQQTSLPLIMHGTPLGGVQELIYGLADMYMIGGTLEDTMAAGWACGRANVQVLLQFEGGTLGKAMAMHMASVLPTHTAHSINLDDQYAEDYTTETIPVVDGASPVSASCRRTPYYGPAWALQSMRTPWRGWRPNRSSSVQPTSASCRCPAGTHTTARPTSPPPALPATKRALTAASALRYGKTTARPSSPKSTIASTRKASSAPTDASSSKRPAPDASGFWL